jgi:hypothetical protein
LILNHNYPPGSDFGTNFADVPALWFEQRDTFMKYTHILFSALAVLAPATVQAAPIYAAQNYALSFEATIGATTNVSASGSDRNGMAVALPASDIINGLPWRSGDTFRATWNIAAGSYVSDTATLGSCEFFGGPPYGGCRLFGNQSVSIIDPVTNTTRITFGSWHYNDEGAVDTGGFYQGPGFTFSADGYVVSFRPGMRGSANPPFTYFFNDVTGAVTTENIFSIVGASVAASNFTIDSYGIIGSGGFKDAITRGPAYDSVGQWFFNQGFSFAGQAGGRWLLNGVVVPEPAPFSLLCLGIAGLAWRRRKMAIQRH